VDHLPMHPNLNRQHAGSQSLRSVAENKAVFGFGEQLRHFSTLPEW
jgi:hypothetical protein